MAESTVPAKRGMSPLTLALIFIVAIFAAIGALLSPTSSLFIPGLEGIVDTLLTVITNIIYLIGGGLITFGTLAVTIRFIQSKLKDTYKPSGVTRYLSGYLTLSLEFFCGAEIIKM
jgi:hypothetical protein